LPLAVQVPALLGAASEQLLAARGQLAEGVTLLGRRTAAKPD
jgi:hypothetical protein